LISSYFSFKHIFKTISAIRACHRFLRDLLSGVSPIADSRRPLPSSWHPSRCTLRRLHGNHLHIYRLWRGAFRKGQPNSIIELRHATAIGPFAKWANGKNKEGIRAMKTACGLPNVHEGGQAAIAVNVVKRCIVRWYVAKRKPKL